MDRRSEPMVLLPNMDSYLTLIIVDDERIIREGLRDMVDWHRLGFHVLACFEDGKDALDYLAKHAVDAVLTDIKMDEVSGISVSQYVAANLPETKVVVLSGYRDFSFAQQAVQYKVFRYLVKPVDFGELEATFTDIRQHVKDQHGQETIEDDHGHRWRELLPLARRQFFADLVAGALVDEDTLLERFAQLDLPFGLRKHPCCLLTVATHARPELLSESVRLGVLNTFAAEIEAAKWHEIRNLGGRMTVLAVATFSQTLERFESILRSKILEVSETVKSVFRIDLEIELVAVHDDLLAIAQSRPKIRAQPETGSAAFAGPGLNHHDPIVQRVLKYLDDHFGQDVSLSSAADKAYLSPVYFSKYIKEHTGKTFTEHLTGVRVEKAIGLLRENRHSIGEISTLVGYANPRYFSRVFRKETGYGPREYRVQILAEEPMDD
jgi:two-component system, response regulator YesN